MKVGLRQACLSAAVFVGLWGTSQAQAQSRNLLWDATGSSAPAGADGPGNWDLTSSNWVDPVTGTNVTWSNTNPDSATFGTGTTSSTGTGGSDAITLTTNITVQDITLGTASNGAFYNIQDQFDGNETLTLAGNLTKTAAVGGSTFFLTAPIALTAGNHVVALNDTPGDLAEVSMTNAFGGAVLSGAGSLTIDNGASFAQWGTLGLSGDSTYTGGTNINKGRLVIVSSGGLGTGTATIGAQGALSIGGAGLTQVASLNISTPINITRNTYTGTDFNDYPDAIISANTGNGANVVTFSGPFTVDSTDARVSANTSTIVISSNIQQGPDVTAGVLTVDGDFAGFVTLTGDNRALLGGIKIMGGAELNVSNENNLGGPSAPLTFAGGTFHPVGGFLTNFGSHVINTTTFSGGFDVDQNQQFTVDQPLGDANNAVGSIGKRGLGTLNLNSTINLRGGQSFFDSGTVNVNSSVTLASLHLRSPIVNIGTGGSITTTGGFDSFGQDSTGTNGGPDKATINITGTGQLIESTGDDFNVSDNANTQGTINIQDNGVLTTGGITFLGKANGAVGTINQSGGSFTINRNGNFGFVIADGRFGHSPTGHYNFSGGTFTSAGEVYVGEGAGGTGSWMQTGGTANINNWFVVGRENAIGTVDISGGTINHSGGNMSMGDSPTTLGTGIDLIKVHGTAVINDNAGDFYVGTNGAAAELDESNTAAINVSSGQVWVGNGGGGNAVMNVADSASLSVNNWFAVGRGGGTGAVNFSGGTITKTGGGQLDIGAGGTGTLNQTGGALTSNSTWIAEGGTGTVNLSGGTASLGALDVGQNGGNSAVLNISGAAAVTAGPVILANANSVTGKINLNGGTLTASGFTAQNGGGTGAGTFFFNGGTVEPSADATNFIGAKVHSVVSTGGANVNPNAHSITINSALTHDASLAGADGGLTVSGTGTLTLAGANTYTGPTNVQAGTLVFASNYTSGSALNVADGATAQVGGTGTSIQTQALNLNSTGTLDVTTNSVDVHYGTNASPDATIRSYAIRGYNGGTWTGTGITSSTAAADTVHHAVGYADGADNVVAGLAAGDELIKYTFAGDANLDGKVDVSDLGILATNYGHLSGQRWDEGDFTYDGGVDVSDLGVLATNYGAGTGVTGAAAAAMFQSDLKLVESEDPAFAAAVGAVPEPASLSLLVLGGFAIMGRRRKRTISSTPVG